MTKWFDANGTDVDAYPERAWQGGVYSPTRNNGGQMILHRQNPMGLKFSLLEVLPTKKQTEIRLNGTQKKITVDISLERLSAMWYQWQMAGKMIQDAFKDLNNEQREFLITGITPSEWKEIFTCSACKGTGVKTDANGIQTDDVCPVCEGEK